MRNNFLGSFFAAALLGLTPPGARAHMTDQSEPMFEMMEHHLEGGGLMMGYGMGWGMGLFGWVTTLLFWIILVLVIAALWKYINRK